MTSVFTAWYFDISSIIKNIVRKHIVLHFERTGSKYSTVGPLSSNIFKTVQTAIVRTAHTHSMAVQLDNGG